MIINGTASVFGGVVTCTVDDLAPGDLLASCVSVTLITAKDEVGIERWEPGDPSMIFMGRREGDHRGGCISVFLMSHTGQLFRVYVFPHTSHFRRIQGLCDAVG